VELHHVAARILEEELLGVGTRRALEGPVVRAEPVEFGLGLDDVLDGQRDMRRGRILARPLGEG
jgi:hypothetical protein